MDKERVLGQIPKVLNWELEDDADLVAPVALFLGGQGVCGRLSGM